MRFAALILDFVSIQLVSLASREGLRSFTVGLH